eukprot:TRINITY_DN26083_c0_g1_i1.p1 TRINITY_DN26083_c0_g1~~TRINITY_DN26083_c0_g1_i1.p1  ORF type:complete len:282 (-),score=71.95 TRINITY_DN26083_c0_g1_i1:154-897(-)
MNNMNAGQVLVPPELEWWEGVYRIGISLALGSLIGLQRELDGKPAGLRTHTLVCVGSTLIMMLSAYGFTDFIPGDPARMAAQVVSGIGFLGAGAILKEGTSITGLTTAATLWVCAGVGLSVGVMFWVPAVVVTVVTVMVLFLYRFLERKLIHKSVVLEVGDYDPSLLPELVEVFRHEGVRMESMTTDEDGARFTFKSSKVKPRRLASRVQTVVGSRPVRVNGKSVYTLSSPDVDDSAEAESDIDAPK